MATRKKAASPLLQLKIELAGIKPPIWRRPLVWIVVGTLAAAGIGLGVFLKVSSDARVERRDREIAAVRAFAGRIQAQLPDDVQTLPGNLLVVFPTLRQSMESAKAGDIKPGEARKVADEVRDAAAAAAAGIQDIPVEAIIPEDFQADRNRFQDANQFLRQSFLLYRREALRPVAWPEGPRAGAVDRTGPGRHGEGGEPLRLGIPDRGGHPDSAGDHDPNRPGDRAASGSLGRANSRADLEP